MDNREKLRKRIRIKQSRINDYLRKLEPRSNRLTVVGIVCGGLATLLTAGPAAGGESFTKALTKAIETTSPSWRLLCAAATLLSFVSTTAITLYKAQDLANRLAKAQSARARLEALDLVLDATGVAIDLATNQFEVIIQDIAFIPESRV